jgi:polar amino acid transport system substrate-binding protein
MNKANVLLIISILLTPFRLFANSTPLLINDIKWPPFFFPTLEKGKIGFGKELLNHCIDKANYKLVYKNLPVKRTHVYMASGELDVSIYSYKKDRESFVSYGKETLFSTNYGFASKQGTNVSINQLSDLNRYKIGHLAGLSHTKGIMEIINRKEKIGQVTTGFDLDSMFGQMLTTHQRFQVMPNSIETFLWRSKQLGVREQIVIHDYIAKQKQYFVTVSKSSQHIKDPQAFLAKMDTCIRQLKITKKYKTIASKYGLIQS